MADALNLPHSSYARYEDANEFKKPHLPLDLARRAATVLADHGIDAAEVMALAGVTVDEVAPIGLTANEGLLLDHFRGLGDDQRRLLLELADSMGKAATAPTTERPTVHHPEREYHAGASR